MRKLPDPNEINPIKGIDYVTYVKPTIKNPNTIVGDFTYFSDTDFESHVTHHYDFYKDKLIIGKFCQIAKGVNFIMNGANHQMNAASTFPFYIFGWEQEIPSMNALPFKGDTVIGNDVWIGQDSTIWVCKLNCVKLLFIINLRLEMGYRQYPVSTRDKVTLN